VHNGAKVPYFCSGPTGNELTRFLLPSAIRASRSAVIRRQRLDLPLPNRQFWLKPLATTPKALGCPAGVFWLCLKPSTGGNGLDFTQVHPNDSRKLSEFISEHQREDNSTDAGA
jgi:hypothetical protein